MPDNLSTYEAEISKAGYYVVKCKNKGCVVIMRKLDDSQASDWVLYAAVTRMDPYVFENYAESVSGPLDIELKEEKIEWQHTPQPH